MGGEGEMDKSRRKETKQVDFGKGWMLADLSKNTSIQLWANHKTTLNIPNDVIPLITRAVLLVST